MLSCTIFSDASVPFFRGGTCLKRAARRNSECQAGYGVLFFQKQKERQHCGCVSNMVISVSSDSIFACCLRSFATMIPAFLP
jgi:hypothetical protein